MGLQPDISFSSFKQLFSQRESRSTGLLRPGISCLLGPVIRMPDPNFLLVFLPLFLSSSVLAFPFLYHQPQLDSSRPTPDYQPIHHFVANERGSWPRKSSLQDSPPGSSDLHFSPFTWREAVVDITFPSLAIFRGNKTPSQASLDGGTSQSRKRFLNIKSKDGQGGYYVEGTSTVDDDKGVERRKSKEQRSVKGKRKKRRMQRANAQELDEEPEVGKLVNCGTCF